VNRLQNNAHFLLIKYTTVKKKKIGGQQDVFKRRLHLFDQKYNRNHSYFEILQFKITVVYVFYCLQMILQKSF